jgi:hypothetical protein
LNYFSDSSTKRRITPAFEAESQHPHTFLRKQEARIKQHKTPSQTRKAVPISNLYVDLVEGMANDFDNDFTQVCTRKSRKNKRSLSSKILYIVRNLSRLLTLLVFSFILIKNSHIFVVFRKKIIKEKRNLVL